MKIKLTVIVVLLFSQVTFAQDLTSLKQEANKIYTATATLDYDIIMDYTYPKIYEIISREQMKELLIQTFNGNEQMKIKILNVAPNFNYGVIKKIDDQNFCLVDHNLEMDLTLTEKIEGEEVEMMTELMKSAMECESVTFNQQTNTFNIKKRATMIAIADAATNNQWRFINKDKENALVSKLFSKKVIKALGL